MSSLFKIGSIVTLKSHYSAGSVDTMYRNPILGDIGSTPPLMIVVERLFEKQDNQSNEMNSEEHVAIHDKEVVKVKCTWFNSITYSFEEAWFNSRQLILINFIEKENTEEQIQAPKLDVQNNEKATLDSQPISFLTIGQTVVFKTNKYENLKKKATLRSAGASAGLHFESVHKFCAPEFTVIGSQAYISKEPLVSLKTGKEVRAVPARLIKIKFFNPISNKYSEHLLPIECLELTNDGLISEFKDGGYYLIKYFDEFLFGKVSSIVRQHGVPTLILEISNGQYRTLFIPFLQKFIDEKQFVEIEFNEDKRMPKWNEDEYIGVDLKKLPSYKNQYCLIEYVNRKKVISKRLIKIQTVHAQAYEREEKFKITDVLVNSYCYLRKSERTFSFNTDSLISIIVAKAECAACLNRIKFQP
jgi:hypothetical protein